MKNIFRISRIILLILSVFLLHSCKKDKSTPNLTYGKVTDIDGNVYKTIIIGTQTWMAENLKSTRYSNSDLIGTTTPATKDISGESTPKYQWAYDGNENNVSIYGRLYTWYSVTDSRNVCPNGWHIPTDVDWTTLTDFLVSKGYGYGLSENIAKSMAATSGWTTSTIPGTVGNDQPSNNSSGFTALPGGGRANYGPFFFHLGDSGYWWTLKGDNTYGYGWTISCGEKSIGGLNSIKWYGCSVRCVKDN